MAAVVGSFLALLARKTVVTELNSSDLATVLTELLVAAAKWENIGLALGFVSGTLDAIKGPHKPHEDCLRDMLKKWLNTSRPTWDGLIASLRSPLVGMDNLANNLEQKYCSQEASHPLQVPQEFRAQANTGTRPGILTKTQPGLPAIDRVQPRVPAITDMPLGMLAVAGIIPGMPQGVPVLQQTGPASTGAQPRVPLTITGTQPRVPAVTGMQLGIPSVTGQQLGATSAQSQDPIFIYTSYLKRYYLRHNLPAYGKLPASPSKKYTRLASVLKETVTKQEADEFTKETIHGNIDDIAKKTSITMEEIAPVKDSVWPKCILVEGAPGIGKTTFVWEMCRKWSNREILQDYKLVVLLRLREKKARKAKRVSDLFYYDNPRIQHQIAKMIMDTLGLGVLLILEGYDELPPSLRTENSFFTDLIKGKVLPEATVLVTSRPSASAFLHEKCKDFINQHIEILGFTTADIQSYLKDTCGGNELLLSGIQKYLQCYPHIRTMMYVPLNAGIVVEVYRTSKVSNSVIPKTKTQLYQCLVCSLLRRYLSDHPVHGKKEWSISSFEDLPEDVYKQFCELARIADQGIRNNQQVIFNDLPDKFNTLGLMQCVPELYIDRGAAVSYSFLHLTIQEFMAAVHISQSPVKKWIERFNGFSDNERMVMRFVAGLTNLEGAVVGQHHIIHSKVDLLHWIFEAQINYPGSNGGGNKEARACDTMENSSSFDWYVLGYCIAHSDRMWMIGGPDRYSSPLFIRDEGVEGLVQGILECKDQLHSGISVLKMGSSHVTSEGVRQLLRLPKHMLSSLKRLTLVCNPKIGEGGCTLLIEMLPSTLVHLNLSNTGIGVEDCRALNKLLTSSSALETLNISGNYLPPEAVELIFSGVQASTGVNRLKLSMSCLVFSLENCKSLASVLQNNNGTLEQLELSHYVENLPRDDMNLKLPAFTYRLEICIDMQYFWSIDVKLSITGTSHSQKGVAFDYALGYCVSHTNLNYTWTIYSDIESLVSGNFVPGVLDCDGQVQSTISSLSAPHSHSKLKHMLSPLKTLSLSAKFKNGEGGCASLVEMVPATLVHLNLSNTGIGVEDCRALSKLLTSSSALEALNITGNYLPPEAVELIFSGLQASTGVNGLRLYIDYSQFSQQNCESLASVLQNNNATLKALQLSTGTMKGLEHSKGLGLNMTHYGAHKLNLKFSQESSTAIHGSVSQYRSYRIPGTSVSTLTYVLGYCVSHTTHTWDIQLGDYYYVRDIKFGDAEVEKFVQGVLDCEAQQQSSISDLTIHYSRITSEVIRQKLKIPKHMLSSLKSLVLRDSPEIDVVGYTALNTLLQSSSSLETLDLTDNNLLSESVAVVLSGIQKMNAKRGLKLFMTCSQFSLENFQLLVSVLHDQSNLREIAISYKKSHTMSGQDSISLRVLPGPLTAIHGSVRMDSSLKYSIQRAREGRVTVLPWDYVLGYCVSHTDHTWAIELQGFKNLKVERFVQGILDYESLGQASISSLSLKDGYCTTVEVNQVVKLPKYTISSLKVISIVRGCTPLIKKFQETLVELHLGETFDTTIDMEDYRTLSELLSSQSTLEIVSIKGHIPPEAVDMTLSGLQKNTGLKEFSMNSQFSVANCKSLVPVVQKNIRRGTLRRLHIEYTYRRSHFMYNVQMELQLMPGLVTAVCSTVTGYGCSKEVTSCNLEYVLGYCVSHTACSWEIKLNGEFVKEFVDVILDCRDQSHATITRLHLRPINHRVPIGILKYILKLPKHMLSSLKSLSLSWYYAETGVKDCEALNKLLTSSSVLETLDIIGNDLPPQAVELIFSGLQTATELKNLKIARFQLSSEAYELLVNFLRSHSLSLLSLNCCNISPTETGQLVDAIICKDTVECLSLANNPIGDEGTDHLYQYLRRSKSLRTLNLSWNTFTLQAAEHLTSVLHNTTLETLILPDRFSGWIPENLKSRVTTELIERQKSRPDWYKY